MTPIEFAKMLRLPYEVNGPARDPYQLRIRLPPAGGWYRSRLPGMFVHHYFRSDKDEWCHSHPWRWMICFVVTRGYSELRKEGLAGVARRFFLRPGSMNFIWKDTFHKLELHDENGCWTICLVAPRPDGVDDETWGFSPADGVEFESAKDRFRREREEEEREAAT